MAPLRPSNSKPPTPESDPKPADSSPMFNAHSWGLPKHSVPDQAVDILNAIIEDMQAFVAPGWEAKNLPVWMPDPKLDLPEERRAFLSNLRVPVTKSGPSLLLHELGSFAGDPAMEKRIDFLFQKGETRCLVNASGTGKTRHLLEALCLCWGFYFSFTDKSEDLGSGDMDNIQARTEMKSEFTMELPQDDAPEFATKLSDNQKCAGSCFSHVLLARLLVFRTFLTAIVNSGRKITAADPRLWTLLQVNPALLGSEVYGDVFETLSDYLDSPTPAGRESLKQKASVNGLLSVCRELLTDAVNLMRDHGDEEAIPKSSDDRSFFFVVDEVQLIAEALPYAFRSLKKDEATGLYANRPLLREIIEVLDRLVRKGFCAILTGTGLDMDLIQAAAYSVVFKKVNPESIFLTDTGGFYDDPGNHLRYIKRYVPADVLSSEEGQRLLERMVVWLRGRYRMTAHLLSELLLTGFADPVRHFDRWIMYQTRFVPSDTSNPTLTLPPIHELAKQRHTLFNTIQYEKIKNTSHAGFDLHDAFVRIVYESFIRSRVTSSIRGMARIFVECGFARFTNNSTDECCLFEPLVILAAIARMEDHAKKASVLRANRILPGQLVLNHSEAEISSVVGSEANGFESYVGLILAHCLGKPTPLTDLFTIAPNYRPSWINHSARLVNVYREFDEDGEPGRLMSCFVDWPSSRLPTGHLGHTCDSPEATLAWLEHRDPLRAPLCFPDNNIGPDIILKLQLDDAEGSFIWVAVQCKDWTKGQKRNMHPKDYPQLGTQYEAIDSVTPSHFWSETYRKYRPQTAEALAYFSDTSVSEINIKTHHFRLLRVLTILPTNMELGAVPRKAFEDAGEHPLCTLNWEYIRKSDIRHFWADFDKWYREKPDIGAKARKVVKAAEPLIALPVPHLGRYRDGGAGASRGESTPPLGTPAREVTPRTRKRSTTPVGAVGETKESKRRRRDSHSLTPSLSTRSTRSSLSRDAPMAGLRLKSRDRMDTGP